jgi:hypothetical protein
MLALGMAQFAGAGSLGVISGTMSGPAGPMAGVRVNALNNVGTVVSSTTTNAAGAYTLENVPSGKVVVQAVSPGGAVLTTSSATVSGGEVKKNLARSASQSAAAASSGISKTAIWWAVGASAATVGVVAAVALDDDPSPAQ